MIFHILFSVFLIQFAAAGKESQNKLGDVYIHQAQCPQHQNVTVNSIISYLQFAPRVRPHCSSEGSTTTTIMTPPGLNQYLKKSKRSKCTLVMFYSTSCPFSMNIASIFNSLSTIFPNGLLIAGIEAPRGWTIEHGPGPAEFGVLGTPSIILFQGRKEIARFNETEHDLKRIKLWVSRTTKLTPVPVPKTFKVEDYMEPVPTELVRQTDIGLILSIISLSVILTLRFSPNFVARMLDG